MRFSFAVFCQQLSQFAAEQDAAQIGLDSTLCAVHPPYQLSHHVHTTDTRKAESDQNRLHAPGKPWAQKAREQGIRPFGAVVVSGGVRC